MVQKTKDPLCEVCSKLDIAGFFTTEHRSPDGDCDWLKQVNTLTNVREQRTCPFCRILLQIIESSGHSDSTSAIAHRPDVIYLEPQASQHALCGVSVSNEAEKLYSSALHIEVGGKAFHDKIISASETDPNVRQRPLLSIPHQIDPYVNFEVINSWLQDCFTNHRATCTARHVREIAPLARIRQRAIDIQSRQIVPIALSEVRYCALSYVWGKDFVPSLLASTHSSSFGQLPPELPRLFEDTLAACKQLGIPYLWVDAYCVNQRDNDDKRNQIECMDVIYQGSYVTIVAIEGESPDDGLPGASSPREDQGYWKILDCGTRKLEIIPGFSQPEQTWNSRAWTLQETLLSNRLLLFTKTHVAFYCNAGVQREDLSHADDPKTQSGQTWSSIAAWEPNSRSPFDASFRTRPFDLDSYCRLARLYCSRGMSRSGDAYAAVEGLINYLQFKSHYRFVCGLPLPFISDAMTWMGSRYVSRGNKEIPTWCWSAWHGDISYPVVCRKSGQGVEQGIVRKHGANKPLCPPLRTRTIQWHQPGSINSGAMFELEAYFEGLETNFNARRMELPIISQLIRVRLPIMNRGDYNVWCSQFRHINMELRDAQDQIRSQLTLIEDDGKLTVEAGNQRIQKICLPDDLSENQASRLRSEEVEFLLLKYWYRGMEPYRVWALLVMREGEIHQRLGCIAIQPEVWNAASPQIERIVLR